MTPTVSPFAAMARLAREPSFTEGGFTYELGPEYHHGPDTAPFATHDATGTQFCVSGEPGTPITEVEHWLEM